MSIYKLKEKGVMMPVSSKLRSDSVVVLSRGKMGVRCKVKIHRISSLGKRQVTYSKRKNGLIKKAEEMCTLCDIDIALLLFSPAGRPFLFVGDKSDFTAILYRYFNVGKEERIIRRVAAVEILQEMFEVTEHQIDTKKMLGAYENIQKIAQLNYQKQSMDVKIVDLHKKLGPFSSPESIDNPIELKLVEETILNAMDEIRKKKKTLIEERDAAESKQLRDLGLELSLGSIENLAKTDAEDKNSENKETEK